MMQIFNQTRNLVLTDNALVADSPFKRVRGLLGTKVFNYGKALVLDPCNSVHTFFMRYPIDILFVDKDNKIIEAISALPPFRATKIYFKAQLVVELPAGTIKNSLTNLGDRLSFQ